jgi:queuine tRNA-ribosyltransferase
VFATRIARNGTVFTDNGTISLKKEMYLNDFSPISEDCGCRTCRKFSKSYIRHLFKTKEILGPMITTEHNLYYLQNFMHKIRIAIKENQFIEFKDNYIKQYSGN